MTTYLGHILDQQFGRAAAFLADGGWTPDWRAAADFSGWRLELTPAGLRALTAELAGVVERHRGPRRPARPRCTFSCRPSRAEPSRTAGRPSEPARRAGSVRRY